MQIDADSIVDTSRLHSAAAHLQAAVRNLQAGRCHQEVAYAMALLARIERIIREAC